MGWMYWLRVAGMVAVLAVVLWTMRHLNGGRVEVPLISGGPLNFCPTRVTWVEAVESGAHLEEHNTHWMMNEHQGALREVKGDSAEKWFSQFCSSQRDKANAGPGEFTPVLKIGYVSGPERVISRSPSGIFQSEGITFKSPDLESALRTLPTLPNAPKPGG